MTINHDARRVPVRGSMRNPGPYPYYGASGIVDYVDGYLFEGLHLLIAEDGENLRTCQTPVAFLADGRFWVNNHAHVVIGNHRADTRYLSYALAVTDISGYLTGSAMPKLSQKSMNAIELPLPPLDVQKAIAAFLGSLDDKIEQNRRTGRVLERLARETFKAWFVDFEPVKAKAAGATSFPGMPPAAFALLPDRLTDSPLGPVPQGWEVNSISECCSVIDCLHTKKPDRIGDGTALLLQLNNIRDDGLLDTDDKYLISDLDYARWSAKFETRSGDCVITNVGRVGAVAQIPPGVTAALGRNMTGIRPKPGFPYPTFLLEALLSAAMREEIARNTDTGTILNALNVRNIGKLRLVTPSEELLLAAERILRPIRALMEHGVNESRKLAALRDYLLPRLLSGRVRVREAERAVEEVA